MINNKKSKQKLAYGYVRVSTEEQRKQGFSITEQEEELQNYAKREGFILKNIYRDEGYSAGNVKRPSFQRMLTEISNKENKVHYILVRDASRIIRNLTLKRSLKNVFEKYNIRLIYLNSDVDDSTPEGNLHSDFVSLLDENELKRISPRTIKGLRGSALLGNYTHGSKPPRGYKRIPNTKLGKGTILVRNEDEADQIVDMFNIIASNRMSGNQFVKYLRKNKVFGMLWNRKSLDNIIDNPIYYGAFKTKYFDSEDKDIPGEYKAYWYDKDHHTEPLVNKELWIQAQKALHHYKKRTKHHFVFSRLVYCIDSDEFMYCESAWKKTKNSKRLYKYYTDKKIRKRLNENKLIEVFNNQYSLNQLSDINRKIYDNLENIIRNKYRRRNILNEDYDNGLILEDDYIESIRELNLSILDLKKRLNNLQDKEEQFINMTYEKQRAIVMSHVKRVNINFRDNIITFDYLK